jgi:hypothetical protein
MYDLKCNLICLVLFMNLEAPTSKQASYIEALCLDIQQNRC